MNLPAILNVALGLVVLYFLLSTIASLLLEILTSWARYREEILFVTINRLLAGQPDTPWNLQQLVRDRVGRRLAGIPGLGWLGRLLSKDYEIAAPGRSGTATEEDIVQRFWKHPSMKSLATPGADAPPSVDPAVFARVLVGVAIPRDSRGALPANALALRRALRVLQPGVPEALRRTLGTLLESGEVSPAMTGDTFWASYQKGLARWFEEATKRATEQYRQTMQFLLLGTGFVLALLLNADTIRTLAVLSHDRSLSEATAAYAATLAEKTPEAGGAAHTVADRPIVALRENLAGDINRLRDLEAIGFPLGWSGYDSGFVGSGLLGDAQQDWQRYRDAHALLHPSLLWALWHLLLVLLIKLVGLAITALAVAQGAPFWYEIMSKLVSLRKGQGQAKEREKTDDGSVRDGQKTPSGFVDSGGTTPLDVGHDLAATDGRFDARKAYWLALAANAAYNSEAEIKSLIERDWYFHDCQIFNVSETQVFCAHDDQVVVVAFRGTDIQKMENIVTDLKVPLVPEAAPTRVHKGFQEALKLVREDLAQRVGPWLQASPGRRLLVTGHSLGGALATLYFTEAAKAYPQARPALYTFGCPKVGNEEFARQLDVQHAASMYRLINETDLVPEYPMLPHYTHAGHSVQFEPGGAVRTEISGLSRILGYAAGAARSFKEAGKKAVDDHGMTHYVERCAKLVGART